MEHVLYGTKNAETSHMRVFAAHVIRYHDNLQDIGVYWLAVTRNSIKAGIQRKIWLLKPTSRLLRHQSVLQKHRR